MVLAESHELLCDIWRDFREDPELRVAVITGTGDAFTAGADLKTHAPEWQTIGPMVGRERIEDGLCGITRGPLSRITKPIVAAINGWCVGHGIELVMACDIRIASDRAQLGTFEVRPGMHPPDGGIVFWPKSVVSELPWSYCSPVKRVLPSGHTRRTWSPGSCHMES